MRTGVLITAICGSLCSCGEFSNLIGLAVDTPVVVRSDASAVCADLERIDLTTPNSMTWIQGRPNIQWLRGTTASGAHLVWTASNLPAGLELTDPKGAIGGTPTATGASTVTITAQSVDCPDVSSSQAVTMNVVPSCSGPDCPDSPSCDGLRFESVALQVEYLEDAGGRRTIGAGESLASDHLLVETVTLNPAGSTANRTLILAVPNSKDTILVHYTLPGGVYAPVSGQRIDLRYVHGTSDDRYLFLTIDHLKRFTLVDGGVLGRDELQRVCPGNPIGLHCQLPEVDWVPLDCEHPSDVQRTPLALETVTAADEGPGVVQKRIGAGQGLITGGVLLMLVDAYACSGSSCDGSPSPYRATLYEIPGECAVCRIGPWDPSGLVAPVEELQLVGEVIHPQNSIGADFTWTSEPPATPGVFGAVANDNEVLLNLPMVGEYTVRMGCTARSRKANLKSCGPAETKVVVKQRDDRPLRVEFGWFVPAGDEVPSVPPMLLFNADAALVQGPGLQVIEPSSFGVLVIEYEASNTVPLEGWVRVLVEGAEVSFWSGDILPSETVILGDLGPDGVLR